MLVAALFLFAAFFMALGAWIGRAVIKRRYGRIAPVQKPAPRPIAAPPMSVPAVKPQQGVEEDAPRKLVIGASEAEPVMSLEILNSAPRDYAMAKPVQLPAQTISRLSPLLQGFPTAVLGAMSGSSKLMVVEMAGPLTEAANVPGGFRAFSMGAKGISEHATLFKPETLQMAAGAAMAWQLVSMVVAQKHLADINAKLKDIQTELAHISRFLNEERRAQITGAYGYFQQVFGSVAKGERDPAVRQQIENHEANLIMVQEHLFEEFTRKLKSSVSSDEWFGTEKLTQAIGTKLEDLDDLTRDLMVCARTRVAGWLVLSLYPGNQALKDARRQDILHAMERVTSATQHLSSDIETEINRISSWLNKESTLQERRNSLRLKRDGILQSVARSTEDG
ncbi:MAG: hypothetical protein ACP5RC_11190, partial [Halothiobacillaceae bacterium]